MIWILAILGIALVIFLSGCKKPVKPEPTITEVKLNVPYEKAKGKDWCLPASASMVFSYYGNNVSQSIIASRVIVNGDASTFRLISFARELGFISERARLSIIEIEEYLRQCIPLIAIQKYSLSITNSHSRVIIGFDSEKSELTLHDPSGKSNYKMGYDEFFQLGFDDSKMSKIVVIRR